MSLRAKHEIFFLRNPDSSKHDNTHWISSSCLFLLASWSVKTDKCKRQNIFQKICFWKLVNKHEELAKHVIKQSHIWYFHPAIIYVYVFNFIFYLWTSHRNIKVSKIPKMLPKNILYFLEMNWVNITFLWNVMCIPPVILNLVFKGKTLTSAAHAL